MAGYDHIVIILEDDTRIVKRCRDLESPPPEIMRADKYDLVYVGTIWETPHYKIRVEVETEKVNAKW